MRLGRDFFHRDCLEVAPDLVGKLLVRRLPDGTELRLRITETEVYRGEADTACHAHRGRTKRTEQLYRQGGVIYVYLCYGIHWLLNLITGEEGQPQGVLIRACEGFPGPGRLTRRLEITGALNGLDAADCRDLFVEDDGMRFEILTDKRVGIGYASQEDQDRLWRFKMGPQQTLETC
jgi:DNA-3-methyladenine glycosylase